MTNDEKAIRQLVDDWSAATKVNDLETILGLMTDDVIFMTPGSEPFGKAAFAEAMKSMGDTRIDADTEIVEMEVIENFAFIRNQIVMTVFPPNGAPVHHSGYSLTLMRKGIDGRWRLMRDANLVSATG